MKRLEPTPEIIEAILARVPEGYLTRATLNKRVRLGKKSRLDGMLENSSIVRNGNLFFDSSRISLSEVKQLDQKFNPTLPPMNQEGWLLTSPIVPTLEQRDNLLQDTEIDIYRIIFDELAETGYAFVDNLAINDERHVAMTELLAGGELEQVEDLIYDPLRLGERSARNVLAELEKDKLRRQVTEYLEAQAGQTASFEMFKAHFGAETFQQIIENGGFSHFSVSMKRPPYSSHWLRIKTADAEIAEQVATEAVAIKDEEWGGVLGQAGNVLRESARDGSTLRSQVIARTYTIKSAAKQLGLREATLYQAIRRNILTPFTDPEGKERLSAEEVENLLSNTEQYEQIAQAEIIRIRDIALACEHKHSTIKKRFRRIGLNGKDVRWRQVRGRWELPESLAEFNAILKERKAVEKETRQRERELERQREAEEKRIRDELRQRLVSAFPTWRRDDDAEQRIILHVGGPNSGKTHDSLEALKSAGEGWYLAPLRLLAYEIFDRLNADGVLCNLLTGEEHIPIPGAKITAATIEMFNPTMSGDCIIIDEAQMLADSDRGWAWTRALMENQCPEIHVIAPQTAQHLIEKLAGSAAIPMQVIEHQRLAPIKVAERAWRLDSLPAHTILVAFSRQLVLHLKTQLEEMGRSVSVVYGSLPPEVRRKQADRFASGETEICIATDAVGMGLNLPADGVCFYEIEKFDGQNVRLLKPSEIQQIGGRAGRYGLSQAGIVSTLSNRDLRAVKQLFYAEPEQLTHARVAPSVQDLEMIPGSLSEKLLQWSQLESIPESLKGSIKTADLGERIELAQMLKDEEVEQLGLAHAMRLINAPTRQNNRDYWLDCSHAILEGDAMSFPPDPPPQIDDLNDLELMEHSINCADIYLWLASRREFQQFGRDEEIIRQMRRKWSLYIDTALLLKLDTRKRCPECGRLVSVRRRHRLCDDCFHANLKR